MPIMPCEKDGQKGFKWGAGGTCFVGSGARARAAAVARAVHARQGAEKAEEIEAEIALMEDAQVAGILRVLPPHPDELEPREVAQADRPPIRTTIKKSDDELQIVWAEVYVPNVPDAHKHFMTEREVEKLAYRTLADAVMHGMGVGEFQGSDTQHDNVRCDDVIVESFVARTGDPDFLPGAWVVGLHIPDPERWALVKSGKLNGFSMQANVLMEPREVEIDVPESVEGETGPSSDGDLHDHQYRVRFNEDGEFLGGETTEDVRGSGTYLHSHCIQRGSVTESSEPEGHTHRFALLDKMFPAGTLGEEAIRWRMNES